MYDLQGNKIYEETPWFIAEFPDQAERKKIKEIIAAELTGKDMDGNPKTQGGKDAGC